MRGRGNWQTLDYTQWWGVRNKSAARKKGESLSVFHFFKDFIYLFLDRVGEGSEKERERNINVWLPPWQP